MAFVGKSNRRLELSNIPIELDFNFDSIFAIFYCDAVFLWMKIQ